MKSEVVLAIEILEFVHSGTTVAKSKIDEWARSTDANVLSLLLRAVSIGWDRIQPTLPRGDYGKILINALKVVLTNPCDAESGYMYTSYDLAHQLTAWALEAATESRKDPEIQEVLTQIIDALGDLYRTGDQRQRRCIVDGAVEHLFERDEGRALFASWQHDPDLRVAYDEANQWRDRVNGKLDLLRHVADVAAEKLRLHGVRVHTIRNPEIGTDSIVVECETASSGDFELVIDCDYELLEFLATTPQSDQDPIGVFASYVADSSHWVRGEYDESQRWVNIPTPS